MFHVLYGDTEMAGAAEAVRDVVDEREGEESEERRLIGFNSSTGYPASPGPARMFPPSPDIGACRSVIILSRSGSGEETYDTGSEQSPGSSRPTSAIEYK